MVIGFMRQEDLINEFSLALYGGTGALFVGSGISSNSGVASWLSALTGLAKRKLQIDLTPQDDLSLIAQYIVNRDISNRGAIVHEFKDFFGQHFKLNPYHQDLAWTNVQTIWTTNYDTLL